MLDWLIPSWPSVAGIATYFGVRATILGARRERDKRPSFLINWFAMGLLMLAFHSAARGASPDLNGDGVVDGLDLGILHGAWGEATPGNGVADLDGDGDIDGRDLGVLLGAWGPVTIAVRSDWGVAGTVYRIPAADHDADPSPVGAGWTRYAWGWTTTPTGRRERAFAVHMRGDE